MSRGKIENFFKSLRLSEKHPNMLNSTNNLTKLCEAWNKPEKAYEWRAKLPHHGESSEDSK
jgi:hypothetical protein